MTHRAEGVDTDANEDPLARLERLVNARTSRMVRDTERRRHLPGDEPARAGVVAEQPPATFDVPGPAYPAPAAPAEVEPGLDAHLAAILEETVADFSLDEAAEPAIDLRDSVPVAEAEAPPADLSALLPSLAALRGGLADESPARGVVPPAVATPLPLVADDASALEGFESEMNGAVEEALAAAHAAVSVTAAAPIADEVPEATHPLTLPDLPAFEADMRAAAQVPDELSEFERELAREMLTLDEPIDDGADPLAVSPTGVAPEPRPSGPADFERLVAAPANDNGARRRGAMIAAVIGGIAVLGATGSMLLGGAVTDPTEVAVIRAETEPYKVKPAVPGGRQVPNQNSPVYESVTGVGTAQAKADPTVLVSKSEDVSDLRVVSSTARPVGSAKGGERLDAAATDVDVSPLNGSAVAPQRVRTVKIGPDGSILPAGGSVEPTAPAEVAAIESAEPVIPVQPEATVAEAAEPLGDDAGDAVAAAALEGAPAPGIPVPLTRTGRPVAAAVASRPEVVAEPANPVAAAADATVPVVADGYVVQIASVPSADAARRTYADLSSRFASIIGGRGVDYQVATIDGRGTFHRVRVPASSKADAGQLCSALKSAGGSCFVTR